MTQDQWDTDELGKLTDARFANRIKASQHAVYHHLAELAAGTALPQTREWPDFWIPKPSPRARSKFALRVFRRGRWPTEITAKTA